MMSIAEMKESPVFWQGAFLFAVILLIFVHKVTLEGMID